MNPDIFTHHGLGFILGLVFFPRITLLVSSVLSGGFLWWLGWFIAPHLLVAILAIPYFHSNPVLVVFAWIMAFYGTGAEVKTTERATRR